MILITKLLSGEEVISDTEVVNAEGVAVCVLKKPCLIQFTQSERGIGVQLVPWMVYAKDHTVPIAADMIITQLEVDPELYNKYNSMFGSGIQIPSNGIQLA